MPNVYAVKSGNWSDPTVWNTGVVPTGSDDVRSGAFTVTVDQVEQLVEIYILKEVMF